MNIKTDNYEIKQIYFYITNGCNLKCRHCWIAPKYHLSSNFCSLNPDFFYSIIEQAKPLGLTTVKLTGGEPLLHPQIKDIIDIICSENLYLTIETNGTLCTEEKVELLSKCKEPSISVSLDGANSETHEWIRGVKGSFDDTLRGIKNLVKMNLNPQIIMTLMQHNIDQIENIIYLSESLGVRSLKFNPIQPVGKGKNLHITGQSLNIKKFIEIGQWIENTLSKTTDLWLYYCHPPAFRSLDKMFGIRGRGCRICGILNIMGVLPDGSYALCGIGEIVPELIFGHASNDRLYDIWKNNSLINEIRKGLPDRLEGICRDCIMKKRCLGSCIAQNYFTHKSLWSPFWYCEEAAKAGVFPETRRIQSYCNSR